MARLRGFIWLLAGLVIALVAGVIAFQTLTHAAAAPGAEPAAGPVVEVVVAARALPVRSLITDADVTMTELPVTAVPVGALRSVNDAVGRLSLVELAAGEPLLAARLLDPNIQAADGRLAVFMVEDEVLMALSAQDLMSTLSVLKPGDHVDVLFSLPLPTERSEGAEAGSDEEQSTFALLQNVTISALVGGQTGQAAALIPGQAAAAQPAGPPKALLLTLPPQDALVLKYMIDAGGTFDLVLRAPGVEQPFDTDPVDLDYVIDRYDLPIQIGR